MRSWPIRLVVLSLLLGTLAVPASVSARTRVLGSLNIAGYCQSIGYATAGTNPSDAHSWSCRTSSNGAVPADLAAVCQWQYGLSDAYAGFTDSKNAYSWLCYENESAQPQQPQSQQQQQQPSNASLVDNAGLASQSAYPTINHGDSTYIKIVVQNTGTTTWSADQGYSYNASGPWTALWGAQKPLWQTVAPGQTLTFAGYVGADQDVGAYDYSVMIAHNGQTFGPNFYIHVIVQGGAPLPNNGYGGGGNSQTNPVTPPTDNTSSGTNSGDVSNGQVITVNVNVSCEYPANGCNSVTLTAGAYTKTLDYRNSPNAPTGRFTFDNVPRGVNMRLDVVSRNLIGTADGPIPCMVQFDDGVLAFWNNIVTYPAWPFPAVQCRG